MAGGEAHCVDWNSNSSFLQSNGGNRWLDELDNVEGSPACLGERYCVRNHGRLLRAVGKSKNSNDGEVGNKNQRREFPDERLMAPCRTRARPSSSAQPEPQPGERC